MIKMTDIAKAAGVSIATVGRVIHNNGYVSPQTRERVEEQIRRLGYVPNQMARSLKNQKSGIIGSLVTHNPNDLYEKINGSIIEAADRAGFELLTLEGRRGRDDEQRLINKLIGLQVDGLVIISNLHVPKTAFSQLHALEIPVVAVEREYNLAQVDNLLVRDFEGVTEAVVRIGRKGHRRIALIASETGHRVEDDRLGGYLQGVKEAGADRDEALICLMADYSPGSGYAAMERLLALENPPTAVLATADTLAVGAMQLLYRQRIRIPDDMSIVGYDNVLAETLAPRIDSVDLSVRDIGNTVIGLLAERMADYRRPPQTRYIETVYIDRGTVKSLP